MSEYTPPCAECGGKCCAYIAIELDKPRSKKDYDYIRWYLTHNNVNVFVDHDRNWFVEFRTPCSFIKQDKKCSIYEKRPNICSGHGDSEGSCEFYSSPYLLYFTSISEFETYLDKKNIDWRYKKSR